MESLLKKTIIFIVLFFLLEGSFAQIDTRKYLFIDYIPLYEVNNQDFYNLLDSISEKVCDCIFYQLDRDFIYYIQYDIINDFLRINIISYDNIHSNFTNFPRQKQGVLFYKEKLVLFQFEPHFNQAIIYNWIRKTDSIIDLKILRKEVLPSVGMGYEFAMIDAKYSFSTKKMAIERRLNCDRTHIYGYYVSENDTWEELSRKFRVSIEVLQTINGVKYDNLILKKGDYIYGRYYIENDSLKFYRMEENHY